MNSADSNPRKRILVVDDDAELTMLVRMILRDTGRYEVRVINHAALAATAVEQFRPDLVLLDVIMPEMDGGAVAAAIRAHPSTCDTPILFLTAAVTPEEVKHGAIGGERYLEKPVTRDRLLGAVAECVGFVD